MIDNEELANLRRTWSSRKLDESSVCNNPVDQFNLWMQEAIKAEILDPNAMTLATSDKDGKPSARIVLLKGIDEKGLVFFTNYGSKKSGDLLDNPKAAVVFFWKELERQLRVMGNVVKVSREESESYFKSRPYESKIGAWASKQSTIVPDRNYLEEKFDEAKKKFPSDVPLPEFWGGFRIIPERFEFWQGRENRMHDRVVYQKKNNDWEIVRLAP